MKKTLLLALSVVAIVSCKRTVETDQPTPGQSGSSDVIQLAIGTGGVALTMAEGDPVANEGVRKFFIVGDQIALYAAYCKAGTAPNDSVPDWAGTGVLNDDSLNQVGPYFKNIPAQCMTPGSIAPADQKHTAALFNWGADGLGGVGVDRIYPRNNRGLFIYGYYPYSTSDTVKQGPIGELEKGPQLTIVLKEIAEITDAPRAQPDILYTKGKAKVKETADAKDTIVRRQSPLDSLVFNHALAQINFKVARNEGAAKCDLRKIEFSVPKNGVMSIMNGKITVTPPVDDAGWIKYVIKDKVGDVIPVVTSADPDTKPLTVLELNPLMIFPLIDAEAKTCKLSLTVYYGTATDPSSDTKNEKTFTINLNIPEMKPFLQGKKNTLTMQMSETTIYLKADINPWVDNADADNSIIPVE